MNRRNLLLAVALVPVMALAQTTTMVDSAIVDKENYDTTFVLNSQKIAVSQNDGKTTVAVYGTNGTQMKKMSETQFIDGQEVERVYVTSPFVPKTFSRRHSLQYSHYPFMFGGFSTLTGSAFGTSGNKLTDDGESAEWGFTGVSFAFPINNSLAVTASYSLGQVTHHFNPQYMLNTVDGVTRLELFKGENENEHLSRSYLQYWVVRFPLMLEWSRRFGGSDAFFAVGPSLEYRFYSRSRYQLNGKKHTLTKQNNINPVGLNLDVRFGYGCMVLYARTALTPLLKTSCAPEWHPFTVGVGLRF